MTKILTVITALALSFSAAGQTWDSSMAVTLPKNYTFLPDTSYIIAAIATCNGCAVVSKAGIYISSQQRFLVRNGGNKRTDYVPLKDWEKVLGYVTCDGKSIWFKK